MNFGLDIPVRIIWGRGCIPANPSLLCQGSRALIVTGKSGASRSGALADVTRGLDKAGIGHILFDRVPANPPLLLSHEAGRLAADKKVDFIIGIGGGSAMDAAKAIAAFAANRGLSPEDIYSPELRTHSSLPIVLVPTTSGTGSEANPYSVLTLPDGKRKKSFSSRSSWAKVAFVDPAYTDSLPRGMTVSTALDAFAHAMESYLSPKSTDTSRMFARYSARGIWNVLSEYPDSCSPEQRDDLAASSCAAGAAISVTGTGFPHPLGYSLTLLDGIPHGAACAAFHGDYIRYNMQTEAGKALLTEFASYIGATPAVLAEYLPALAGVDLKLTEDEIQEHVGLILSAKNYTNSPYVLSPDEIYSIYRSHFGDGKSKT